MANESSEVSLDRSANKKSESPDEVIRRLEQENEALRLENARLRQALEWNQLIPEAWNRGKYLEAVQQELKRIQRSGDNATLGMIDLDRFKRVNDTYGHPVGDLILKIVGRAVNNSIRESDFFGRVGGEELSILLRDTNVIGGTFPAERISHEYALYLQIPESRDEIRDILPNKDSLPQPFNPYQTISVGLVTAIPGQSFDYLYAKGDEALYKAKMIRHMEEELVDIPADETTGKIAIFDGATIRVINTDPRLVIYLLNNRDLTNHNDIREWFSVSVYRGFDEFTASVSNGKSTIALAKYREKMQQGEREAINIVTTMKQAGKTDDEIKQSLMQLIKKYSTPNIAT